MAAPRRIPVGDAESGDLWSSDPSLPPPDLPAEGREGQDQGTTDAMPASRVELPDPPARSATGALMPSPTSTSPAELLDSLLGGEDRPPGDQRKWREMLRKRIRYYIPVIGWLPRYSVRDCLRADAIAGLTVASLLVPQSLSYAQALVRVPPIHGLLAAFWAVIVYGIMGTSRQLSVGPEALVSILAGSAIRDYMGSAAFAAGKSGRPLGPEVLLAEAIHLATLLCLLVGLLTFLLGFFRLGFLDSVLSRALLRGFVLAVACVVMIDMADELLGLRDPRLPQCGVSGNGSHGVHGGIGFANALLPWTTTSLINAGTPNTAVEDSNASPVRKLLVVLADLPRTHALTASISAVSIAFLLVVPMLKRSAWARRCGGSWVPLIPEILVLVVLSTMACWAFRWDCLGVNILNHMGGEAGVAGRAAYLLPHLPPITLGKVKFLILSATLISVIGFVESIAVAKTYATKYNYGISPNRELVAMGVGNVVASLFGAFPSFGSLGRSSLADSAGARTQMWGLICSGFLLATLLWLLPLFTYLPLAVCSAIITVAALRLIELRDIHFLLGLGAWSDLGLMAGTFLTTLFLSIETGTLLSVGISLLLVVKYSTRTKIAVLRKRVVLDEDGLAKVKYVVGRAPLPEEGEDVGCLIIKLEESLFFGNTGQLKDKLKRIEVHGDLGIHPGEDPRPLLGAGDTALPHSPLPPLPTSSFELGDGEDGPLEERDALLHARHLHELEEGQSPGGLRTVILDIGNVLTIDATATQILLEVVESYRARHVRVCFVKLRPDCESAFVRSGIWHLVGANNFFPKVRDAVATLYPSPATSPARAASPSP